MKAVETSVRHIALVVGDLRAAEQYYADLFHMDVIGREARLADGMWSTLRPDKGWRDVEQAGLELDMVSLRAGRFVLALFRGDAASGQVFAIGVTLDQSRLDRVAKRATGEPRATANFEFEDRYGIRWQLSADDAPFRTSGEIAGRWLSV